MRSVLFATVLVLLAGCATTEKAKQTWIGASYDDVVRTWGPPVRSGKLSDGSEVHTWVAEGGPTYRSGPSVGFGIGGFGIGGGGRSGTSVGVGASVPIHLAIAISSVCPSLPLRVTSMLIKSTDMSRFCRKAE